ncbi:hypothetical protein [Burkholderia diffusa]|uniref:hypothetical protein n=1 Tax=Burkholderia diffusa TaxID=488732 RepID=UPI0012D8DDAB|nr:hypothetical protein [Burkholderia diffusa]
MVRNISIGTVIALLKFANPIFGEYSMLIGHPGYWDGAWVQREPWVVPGAGRPCEANRPSPTPSQFRGGCYGTFARYSLDDVFVALLKWVVYSHRVIKEMFIERLMFERMQMSSTMKSFLRHMRNIRE